MRVLVVHGPNLNMLGTREPDIYGSKTLDQINAMLLEEGARLRAEIKTHQSNSEGELVTAVQQAAGWADVLIINQIGRAHV